MASVRDIASESEYQSIVSSLPSGTLISIFFHTPWAEPCKQMRTFFDTLSSQYSASDKLAFLAIDAETLYDISEAFDVTAVPFFALVRDGITLQSISGSNSAQVRDAIEKEAGVQASAAKSLPEKLSATQPKQGNTESKAGNGGSETRDLSEYAPAASDPKTGPEYSSAVADAETKASQQREKEKGDDLNTRLAELVKAAPVMLFMKGTPSSPQCGFSRQLVGILRERGVRYGFFNILADEEVRQGLKIFADWPTFPQLWVGGELVGGLDIVKEEIDTDPDFFAQYSVSRSNGDKVGLETQNAPQTSPPQVAA